MKLKSLIRNTKSVVFTALYNTDDEEHQHEERKVTAKEAPVETLDKALQALAPTFCSFLEVPPAWKVGLLIKGIAISRTKHGTRSACILGEKTLDAMGDGGSMKVNTPFVRIDKPSDGDDDKPVAKAKEVKALLKVLDECDAYATGTRQQMLLEEIGGEGDGTEETEDDSQPSLV